LIQCDAGSNFRRMTTHTTLCVAGGGSVAVSFLHHLVKALAGAGFWNGMQIVVLEPNDRIGRGSAYCRDLETNLLNIAVGAMSAAADDRSHFRRWLQERGIDTFRGRPIDDDSYVSRALFGEYLESVFMRTWEAAENAGIAIRHVRKRAQALLQDVHGRQLVLLDDGTRLSADHVVLTIGNLESQAFPELRGRPGYHDSPYPTSCLCDAIAKDASVCVVGTSLSAVDAIVSLASEGHTGPITAISRHGRLPTVRSQLNKPVSLRPQFKALLHQLRKDRAALPLDAMIHVLRAEFLACAGALDEDESEIVSAVPPAAEFIEREIELAQTRARPWQSFLNALNDVIEVLWHLLGPADRARFVRDMKSVWMARRVSFPLDNALALRNLMRCGQLEVRAGFAGVRCDPDGQGFLVEQSGGGSIRVAHVINATSFSVDAAESPMPLLRNMLADGSATAHPFGGLVLDFDSGCLVTRGGAVNPHVTVLGSMAAGTWFWTNSMDINARLAMGQATHLAARLRMRRDDPLAVGVA